jgi:hypothetical protein
MNRGDIKTEVLVRSGKDTTSAWTSEAFINDWINQNHRFAAGYKPWPFTVGRVSTTWAGAEEISFEGYKTNSIRFIQIGGKRLQKIIFEDYQKLKEEQPQDKSRVYSNYADTLFINTAADVSGTLTSYGQYVPAEIADGDANDLVDTIFTPNGDEGNQAIIELTLGDIAKRDSDMQKALAHRQEALSILDALWKRVGDEGFAYQTKDTDMFSRFDILRGGNTENLFKRDQWGNW